MKLKGGEIEGFPRNNLFRLNAFLHTTKRIRILWNRLILQANK